MVKSKVVQQAATPTETPEEIAARQAEQARADAQVVAETQGLLKTDTQRKRRQFGLLSSGAAGGQGSGALRLRSGGSATTAPLAGLFDTSGSLNTVRGLAGASSNGRNRPLVE